MCSAVQGLALRSHSARWLWVALAVALIPALRGRFTAFVRFHLGGRGIFGRVAADAVRLGDGDGDGERPDDG